MESNSIEKHVDSNSINNNVSEKIFKESRCRIYWIDGEKFKTQICTIVFHVELTKDTVTKTALLAQVLKQGCNKYKTFRELTIKSEEMFGAIWDIQVVQKGEMQLLTVTIETIKNVDTAEAIAFLMESIHKPLVDNGGFDEEIVNKQQKILKSNILAEKDDKKYFAKSRCLQKTAKGTPLEINLSGYTEDVDDIDGKILYNYFLYIRDNMPVKVFFCGDEHEKKELIKIRSFFKQTKEFPKLDINFKHDIPDEKFVQISENSNIEQARVLITFDTDAIYGRKNYATLLLFAQILGGGGNSLLFKKIREEKNMCYEIKAYNYPLTQYLFVETGVEAKNKKQVGVEVLKIIENISKNGVEAETLEEAKRTINRQYEMILDQPWALIDFFIDEILWNKDRGIKGFLNQINYVTNKDIIKMARKLKPKIFYSLEKKED